MMAFEESAGQQRAWGDLSFILKISVKIIGRVQPQPHVPSLGVGSMPHRLSRGFQRLEAGSPPRHPSWAACRAGSPQARRWPSSESGVCRFRSGS